MAFDINGALKAGYSMTEIADHLAKGAKFNSMSARQAGYSDEEIIDHLLQGKGKQAPERQSVAPADVRAMDSSLMSTPDVAAPVTDSFISAKAPVAEVQPSKRRASSDINPELRSAPQQSIIARGLNAVRRALSPYDTTEAMDPADIAAAQIAMETGKGTDTVVEPSRRIEKAVKPIPGLAAAGLQQGEGGLVQAVGEMAPNTRAAYLGPVAGPLSMLVPWDRITEAGKSYAESGVEEEKRLREKYPAEPGTLPSMVQGAGQSFGMQLVPMLSSIVTANPAPALAAMSGITAGQTYHDYRERGHSPEASAIAAAGQGIIEGGTELLPVTKLLNIAGGKQALVKSLIELYGSEVPGEMIATLTQDMIDKGMVRPNMTVGEMGEEIKKYFTIGEAALAQKETVGSTLIQTTATAGLGVGARTLTRAAANLNRIDPITGGLTITSPAASGMPLLTQEQAARRDKLSNIMQGETEEAAQARLQAIEARKQGAGQGITVTTASATPQTAAQQDPVTTVTQEAEPAASTIVDEALADPEASSKALTDLEARHAKLKSKIFDEEGNQREGVSRKVLDNYNALTATIENQRAKLTPEVTAGEEATNGQEEVRREGRGQEVAESYAIKEGDVFDSPRGRVTVTDVSDKASITFRTEAGATFTRGRKALDGFTLVTQEEKEATSDAQQEETTEAEKDATSVSQKTSKQRGWNAAYLLAQIAQQNGTDLTKLSRTEYADFAVDHGAILEDDQLRMSPSLRSAASIQQIMDMRKVNRERLNQHNKESIEFYNEMRNMNTEDNGTGVRASNNNAKSNSWFHFHINGSTNANDAKTHKAYLGFDNVAKSLTAARFKEFMAELQKAGYNGQVKSIQDTIEQGNISDQIVMHGASEADVTLAHKVAKQFWGDEVNFTDTGHDVPGKSYSQWLAEDIANGVKQSDKSSRTSTAPTTPTQVDTSAEGLPGRPEANGITIPDHVARAVKEPREVPTSVGVATKQQTKETLNAKLSNGEVTPDSPIRLTTVEELHDILTTGKLREGKDFEGRSGISAQVVDGKKPIVAYGPNDRISAAIVFPKEAARGKGESANEVKVDANTDPKSLRFVIDGHAELLTFEQLQEAINAQGGQESDIQQGETAQEETQVGKPGNDVRKQRVEEFKKKYGYAPTEKPAHVSLPADWKMEVGKTRTKEGHTFESEVDWHGKRLVFSEQKHMDNPEIVNHEVAHVIIETLPEAKRDALFDEYVKAAGLDEWTVKNNFHHEKIAMDYGDYLTNPGSVTPELKAVFEKHLGEYSEAATPEASSQASATKDDEVKSKPEIVKALDRHGNTVYIDKAELDNPDKNNLRRYNAKGERLVDDNGIHRSNIITDAKSSDADNARKVKRLSKLEKEAGKRRLTAEELAEYKRLEKETAEAFNREFGEKDEESTTPEKKETISPETRRKNLEKRLAISRNAKEQEQIRAKLEKLKERNTDKDPNIGREWNATYGRQRIVAKDTTGPNPLYDVLTVETGAIRRYGVDQIEDIIKKDEHRLTPEYEAEQKEQKEIARLRAERDARQAEKDKQIADEIAEFTAGMSNMAAGKARDALLKQISFDGAVMTRKEYVEKRIAEGRTVKGEGAERRLEDADGAGLDVKALTKTGMDYAEFLLGRKGETDREAEPASRNQVSYQAFMADVYAALDDVKALHNAALNTPETFKIEYMAQYKKAVTDVWMKLTGQNRTAGEAYQGALKNTAEMLVPQMVRYRDRFAEQRKQAAAATKTEPENPIFTEDAYQKARARMKAKLSQLNAGFDPELLQDGMTIAGYHLERGARKFAEYAKSMIDDFGDSIRPYLKAFYNGVRDLPGIAWTGEMDDYQTVQAASIEAKESPEETAHASDIIRTAEEEAKTEATKNDNQGNGSDSQGTLEGGVSRDISEDGGPGRSGETVGGVGRIDADGNEHASERRDDGSGSVAGEQGNIHPDGTGVRPGLEDTPTPPSEPRTLKLSGDNPGNYRISVTTDLGGGTRGDKIDRNLAAIRLVKQLAEERRYPTRAEQDILARYTSWGGLKSVFDPSSKKPQDQKARKELEELLTKEEYFEARQSVLNAHFTSAEVINSMYGIARHFGFDGGNVLEPTFGSGNFIGLMPEDLSASSKWYGAELDPITSKIAQFLYPDSQLINDGFQNAEFPYGKFDLAIGNPPFGDERITDNNKKRSEIDRFKIHNYVIAKSGMHLRPGGLMAMVVTTRFLDTANPEARDYLAQKFKFLGAVRLPNDAFAKNAGTEVTTDLVFFQKLMPGETPDMSASWLTTGATIQNAEGETVTLNKYFADKPGMMLGEPSMKGTMYGGNREEFTLNARPGQNIYDLIGEVLTSEFAPLKDVLKQNQTDRADAAAISIEMNREDVGIGGYFADGKDVYMRGDDDTDGNPTFEKLTAETQWTEKTKLGETRLGRIKGMLKLREATYKLIEAERFDLPEIESLRTKLRNMYESFVQKYGYINDPANAGLMADDVKIEFGLEVGYTKAISAARAKTLGTKPQRAAAKKAAIFTQRILYPTKEITSADSPRDGYEISLSEKGKLDLDYVAKLTGKPVDSVIKELSAEGLIYKDPETGKWVQEDEYLSGNVKAKLKAVQNRNGYEANAKALAEVLPKDVATEEIFADLGALWIGREVYQEFLDVMGVANPTVSIIKETGRVSVPSHGTITKNEMNINLDNQDCSVVEIFEAVANKKAMVAYDGSGDSRTVNKDRTAELVKIGKRLSGMFKEWVFSDPMRAQSLTKTYNDTQNTHAERKFNGKLLKTVGNSPAVKLRNTQKSGAWRMVQSPVVMLDHVVGAGKTFTIVTGVMERKRLGLSRKAAVVVPNHLVGQWAKDFLQLYPGARILAATEKDFASKNRKRLFSRIATGNYDAIIMGHSSFGFIPMERETERKFVMEEIQYLERALSQAELTKDKRTVRNLTNRIAKKREKINALLNKQRDNVATFESMGIDYLVVDESHEFKNLEYSTAMQNVVGMGNPKGAKKSFDLYAKIQYLRSKDGGVVFATGTPISNSLVEMYTILRYLNNAGLKARDIDAFDSWVRNYGSIENRIEYTATQKLKDRTVMATFNNLPELLQLYTEFADTITMGDLKRLYAEQIRQSNKETGANERVEFPVPKVKDEGRILNVSDATPEQKTFMDYLVARAARLESEGRGNDPRVDNALWIMTDARKMALDIRLVDPSAPAHPDNKINRTATEVLRIYKKWDADKGTQLVFCDLSTPAKQAGKSAKAFIGKVLKKIYGEKAKPDPRVMSMISELSYSDQWAVLRNRIESEIERLSELDDDASDSRRESLEEFLDGVSDEEAAALTTVDSGFSVYDELKQTLIGAGIPENEIRFIHDATTPDLKKELFAQVNSGQVRVLIGSSKKMGAGTNVQERVVAEHHMDAPWRPSDVEQREGRAIRQGNALYERDPDGFELEVLAYSTRSTFDAVMWQVLSRKAEMLEQFRSGVRSFTEESSDSASYADFMAESTGSPAFKEKFRLERDIADLESEERRTQARRGSAVRLVGKSDEIISDAERDVSRTTEEVENLGDTFSFEGTSYADDYGEKEDAFKAEYREEMAQFEEAWKEYTDKRREAATVAERQARIAEADEKESDGRAPDSTVIAIAKDFDKEYDKEHAAEKPKPPKQITLKRLAEKSEAAKLAVLIDKRLDEMGDESLTFEYGGATIEIEKELSKKEDGPHEWRISVNGHVDGYTFPGKSFPESKLIGLFDTGYIKRFLKSRADYAEFSLRDRQKAIKEAQIVLDKVRFEGAEELSKKRERYAEVVAEVSRIEEEVNEKRKNERNRYIENDPRRFPAGVWNDGTTANAAAAYESARKEATSQIGLTPEQASGGAPFKLVQQRDGVVNLRATLLDTLRDLGERGRVSMPKEDGTMEVTISDPNVEPFIDRIESLGFFMEDVPAEGKEGESILTLHYEGHPGTAFVTDDTRFSYRITPATKGTEKATVEKAISPLLKKWKNAPEVKVVQSESELPENLKAEMASVGAQGEVDGVFDEGVVYLIADNMPNARDAVRVLLHEAVGHYGVRGLLGKRFDTILLDVFYVYGKDGLQEIADRYGLDLNEFEDRMIACEEKLAELAESGEKPGLVKRAIAAIREWLRSIGVNISLSDADVKAMISRAAGWVERGRYTKSYPHRGTGYISPEATGGESKDLSHRITDRGRMEEIAASFTRAVGASVAPADAALWLRNELDDLGRLGRVFQKQVVMFQSEREDISGLPGFFDPNRPDTIFINTNTPAPHLTIFGHELMHAIKNQRPGLYKKFVSAARYKDNAFDDNGKYLEERYGRKVSGEENLEEFAADYIGAKLTEKDFWERLYAKSPQLFRAALDAVKRIIRKIQGIKFKTDHMFKDAKKAEEAALDALNRYAKEGGKETPRFSRRNRTGDPATDAVLDKIGRPGQTLKERLAGILDRPGLHMEQGLFDQFASLKALDKMAGVDTPDESAYITARMTTGFADTFTAMLNHGAPIWANGWVKVASRDRGILKIFEPVANDLDLFLGWMVGERAQKLMNEGRENYFTQEEIDKLKALKTAENATRWERVRRDYVQYKKKVLDFAEQGGIINPDARRIWDHEEYVPFYRIAEDAEKPQGPTGKRGIASQNSGIRTLKGGTGQLGDIFENILRNFSHLTQAALKNRAAEIALEKAEEMGLATKARWDWKAAHLETRHIVKKIREQLGAEDILEPEEDQLDDFMTLFHLMRPKGTSIVHVLKEGKPQYYEVHDELLLKSLTNLNAQVFQGAIMDLMRFTKRLLTIGVTSMPDFMIRNFVRDTLHTWVINRGDFTPGISSLKGAVKTFREDDDMVQLMAAGGSFHGGFAYGHDMQKTSEHVKKLLHKKGVVANILDTPAKLWDFWKKIGAAGENAARVAIYQNTVKKTGSALQAAFEAKDVMDFSMRGDFAIVKFLCETVPFLGARMQGLQRLGKSMLEHPGSFAVKGGAIALAAVLLYLINRDDDRYKELEEWDKDTYFHFWIGKEHFRLPKPFEVGVLFGTIPERLTELLIEKQHDGKLFASRLLQSVTQTFAIGLPQLISEPVQQWANRDSFTGRQIVGQRIEGLKPEDQKEPWTGATAVEVGDILGVSPKRIEHAVEGYFGTLGTYILGASDIAVRRMLDYPAQPTTKLEEWPVVKSFYRGDEPPKNTKYLTEFYDLLREVDETYNSIQEARKTGDRDRVRELRDENMELLRTRSMMEGSRDQLSAINRRTRRILYDKDMTGDEKREELDELTAKKNSVAKRAIERVESRGIQIPH